MREEAASPTAAQSRRTLIAPETGTLRLTGGVPNVYEAPSGAPSVTAEIPAVSAVSDNPSYGVLLPDGSVWYPGSRKRLPAPLPLRVLVWVLAFATLVAAGADLVIHFHPSWVNPIRRVATAAGATAGSSASQHPGSSTAAPGGSSSVGSAGVTELSPQPAGLPPSTTAYAVNAAPYTVQISASHLTWVGVYSIVNGQPGTAVAQATIQPGQSATFDETGPADFSVGASLVTIKVLSGGTQIGSIDQRTPWNFFLEPKPAG